MYVGVYWIYFSIYVWMNFLLTSFILSLFLFWDLQVKDHFVLSSGKGNPSKPSLFPSSITLWLSDIPVSHVVSSSPSGRRFFSLISSLVLSLCVCWILLPSPPLWLSPVTSRLITTPFRSCGSRSRWRAMIWRRKSLAVMFVTLWRTGSTHVHQPIVSCQMY